LGTCAEAAPAPANRGTAAATTTAAARETGRGMLARRCSIMIALIASRNEGGTEMERLVSPARETHGPE
jgi:hypothetical protein